MKVITKIGAAFLFVLGISSCNKFLDVVPKTQTPQDVLFNNEDGFKDALTGVYIQMKSSQVYGQALSYGTIEQLASSWDVTSGSVWQKIGLFNYSDASVQTAFSSIYGALYNIIANVNSILDNIDANKSVFKTEGLYELIKGESLAIRAYCHFDILRMFGPVPGETSTALQLAYVTKLSNIPNTLISINDFKQNLLKDLDEAENLLSGIDPILKYSVYDLQRPGSDKIYNPTDTYMAYRQLRMNFYAVKGLQSRINLWLGNTDIALADAKVVIEAKNPDESLKYNLGTAATMTSGNYVLTDEHLVGLYDFDGYDNFQTNFASGNYSKGSSTTTINTQLFGNTGTDIRESYLWTLITLDNQAKKYITKKYSVSKDVTLATDFKQIPLIRLSEMYLIAAETAPLSEAQQYWDSFRAARNIAPATLPTDSHQRDLEILKEYRKEFYAEGQAFYSYKRLNVDKSAFLFAPSAATVNYVIPLPTTENINQN